MNLEDILAVCGGAARWERLRAMGVSDAELRAARDGPLSVSHGTYALPDAEPSMLLAVRMGGVVSHASAAAQRGFALWNPKQDIHITVPSWREPMAGVVFHRARLREDDLDPFRPITAPLRTAVDCGRTMPLLDAVVVLDSATHGRRVQLRTLRAAAEAARGHGAAALRQAVRFVDDLAESPLETVLRLLVVLLGADVEIQVRVRGVGRVDIVLDGWLVIEADGFEYHSTRQQYREDRRRGNLLIERRTVVLRFSYEDVRFRLPAVLAQIERVWRMGPPWRSGGPAPQ